jgi:hypothetical protein
MPRRSSTAGSLIKGGAKKAIDGVVGKGGKAVRRIGDAKSVDEAAEIRRERLEALRRGHASPPDGVSPPPNRIYSKRELVRRADEPGPYHNFPESFDDEIFRRGTRTVVPDYFKQAKPGMSADSVQYRLRGTVNGRSGTYEIFARISQSGRTEVIMHRFFKPDP